MILDEFKLQSAVIQWAFPAAVEMWDTAGRLGREAMNIWPGMVLERAEPGEQAFRHDETTVVNAIENCAVTRFGGKAFDAGSTARIKAYFEATRSVLQLKTLKRVSARCKYVREFPTKAAAATELINWNLLMLPSEKVFNHASNEGLIPELSLRFEEPSQFTLVRIGIEEVTIEFRSHPDFPEAKFKQTKSRLYVDFDRGVLGDVDAVSLRMDEWIKGYLHVLRRDIDKVLKAGGWRS